MKSTRIRIGLQPLNSVGIKRLVEPTPRAEDAPDDENNYWAVAIEDGDKFYYQVGDTTIEISGDQFRKVIGNLSLYYFSTALKLHLEIAREKKEISSCAPGC